MGNKKSPYNHRGDKMTLKTKLMLIPIIISGTSILVVLTNNLWFCLLFGIMFILGFTKTEASK